jgi:hypothetical protein
MLWVRRGFVPSSHWGFYQTRELVDSDSAKTFAVAELLLEAG